MTAAVCAAEFCLKSTTMAPGCRAAAREDGGMDAGMEERLRAGQCSQSRRVLEGFGWVLFRK